MADDVLLNIQLQNTTPAGGTGAAAPNSTSPAGTGTQPTWSGNWSQAAWNIYEQNKQSTPPSAPPAGTASPAPNSFWDKLLGSLQSNTAATSFVSSAVASATGSPTMGGLAGTALGAGVSSDVLSSLGPAALLTVATSEIANKISATLDSFARRAGGFVGTMGAPASDSVFDAAANVAGWTDPLQKITGLNLQLYDDVMLAFIHGLQAADKALMHLAETGRRWSPDLAFSMARQEMLNLQQEMYRSQRLGPQLVDFVDARGSATRTLNDIKMHLAETIIPLMTRLMETIDGVLQFFHALGTDPAEIIGDMAAVFGRMLLVVFTGGGNVELFAAILELLKDIERNTHPPDILQNQMLQQFFNFTSPERLRERGLAVPIPKGP